MAFVRYFDIIHEEYVEEMIKGAVPTNWKENIIPISYDESSGSIENETHNWDDSIPNGKYYTINYVLDDGICLFYNTEKGYKFGDDYEDSMINDEPLTDQYFEEFDGFNTNRTVLIKKEFHMTIGKRCFIQFDDHLHIYNEMLTSSTGTAILVYDGLSRILINEYFWNGKRVSYPEMIEKKCLRSESLLREMTLEKYMKETGMYRDVAVLITSKFHVLDCYLYVDPDNIGNDNLAIDYIRKYLYETDVAVRKFAKKWLISDGSFCPDSSLRVLLSDDFDCYDELVDDNPMLF